MSTPVSVQGVTRTQTPDVKGKSVATSPSSRKVRSQSSPAKPRSNTATDGPTIADLTVMVQQLHLENRCLEDQLAERKIEVEELRENLHFLCRGLSAKMKCSFEVTGHADLY
jgi:predicted RNase H-like nuclease (RuvC/YqgF family)